LMIIRNILKRKSYNNGRRIFTPPKMVDPSTSSSERNTCIDNFKRWNQGRRQKNFQEERGNEKKDRKIAFKNSSRWGGGNGKKTEK